MPIKFIPKKTPAGTSKKNMLALAASLHLKGDTTASMPKPTQTPTPAPSVTPAANHEKLPSEDKKDSQNTSDSTNLTRGSPDEDITTLQGVL